MAESENTDAKGKYGDLVGSIISLIVFIALFASLYDYLAKDKEKIQDSWGYGAFTLTEAKHLWNGTWFNKDEISFAPAGLTIVKKSLLTGTKTIQAPYSRIRKIILEEGGFINTMTVELDEGGMLWNTKECFNIKESSSLEKVKLHIYGKLSGQVSIIEQKSVIKGIMANEIFKKKEYTPEEAIDELERRGSFTKEEAEKERIRLRTKREGE